MKENEKNVENRVKLDDASLDQVVGGFDEKVSENDHPGFGPDSKPKTKDEEPQVSIDANDQFDLMRLLNGLPKTKR